MTDQIPADKVRRILDEWERIQEHADWDDIDALVKDIRDLLPAPSRPTLADMHPAEVGDVIESADDPRIAALPVGSILLDRDEEATLKQRGEWTGDGYIPIPEEGDEYGPWTVLHIPKEDDQ